MVIFSTLIPTHRNDGSKVAESETQEILAGLWTRFGGLTIDGIVTGHWIDPADGRHYRDESLKVTIACEPEQIGEAEKAVIEIGRRLGQLEMYFEVRDTDVRFLKVPER